MNRHSSAYVFFSPGTPFVSSFRDSSFFFFLQMNKNLNFQKTISLALFFYCWSRFPIKSAVSKYIFPFPPSKTNVGGMKIAPERVHV